jgi:TolB-like protein/DNA-binding winged helix-turn-helix (wHTH) protein/Tfp pilus assembly protein PilF
MTGSIRFGEWVWDPNTLELRNGTHVATLEPRVAKLLEYMITHPGELLSHDRIIDAVWDGRVVSDEAVRRAVFNLRQALAGGGSDSYIRTIHKKGYVATFPQHAAAHQEPRRAASSGSLPDTAPAVHIGATVPEPPAAAEQAAAAGMLRWPTLLKLAGALALVAALLARLDFPWERAPGAPQTPASATAPAPIAVLPFINFKEDPDSEFLADGLAEELIGMLARNPQLRVTSRSSAFQFKGQNRDVRDIGRQLGVRYVLEGSVRRFEEGVRINIQLVDTETGGQLWSEAYDRTLADWFAVQQDVAVEVARALNFMLQEGRGAGTRSGETTSVEAHLEVLRGRQLLATRSVGDAEQAIEHLQRALTLDPNYALAYARLADAILIQAESTTGIAAARPVVAPLLARALALDPGLGEAYALRSQLSDDPAVAALDLRRGLELNPSYARGHELLAQLQARSLSQIDQAVETIDSAIALDPLTPGNYHAKAGFMMTQGHWEQVVELNRRALELNPNFRSALWQLAQLTAVEGRFADAIGYARRAVALDPRAVPLRDQLTLLYLAVGDIEAARAANNPATPFGNRAIIWAEGEIGQLVDAIYSGQPIALAETDLMVDSQVMLSQALSDKDYGRALAWLSPLLEAGALPAGATGWKLYAYANLAQLLSLSGDTAAASRLWDQMEERMAANESRFPRHALIHAQVRAILLARAGHSKEACAALEQAYSPNPRPFWKVVMTNPAFDGMGATPCFQALRIRIDKYIAAERLRIDAMERAEQEAKPTQANRDHNADPVT